MAAPEYIVDRTGTLARNTPSPDLFTPPMPDPIYNVRVETTWPFQAQPQNGEDLREDLRYFFPTLSPDVIPPSTIC
ncbi:hypothetical protein RRG08_012363 [Elysia crispata]|uniref:Uncharacterized protein n=1 Tax=Elysia crispata TaxID=231223 RepID=A0AAE0ZQ44_9GAST|nr:hypothetical protein RRG08_012363 [Elysia crispata]